MPAPFFSLIIVCRNPGPSLFEAIASVREQRGTSCELVIVDGASTDGTAEKIGALAANPAVVSISEPDRGIYDAMNKGLRRASGHWILFLGADDRLAAPDALARIATSIDNTAERLCCGEITYSNDRAWPAPVRPRVRFRNFLHHQATFYHHSLFDRFRYDETLRIQADYDLNLRLWLAGVRPRSLPVRVSICGAGGLSDSGRWANYREEIVVRHRHFPTWQCWFWDTLSIARYLRKKIVRSAARIRPE